jgi:hypothetical protein
MEQGGMACEGMRGWLFTVDCRREVRWLQVCSTSEILKTCGAAAPLT